MITRLRHRVDDMLLVSLIARGTISVLAGLVLGFVGWLAAWLLIPFFEFTGLALPIVSSLVLGVATSLTAAVVFVDIAESRRLRIAFVACVMTAAVVSCAITFTISINASHYTYLTRGIVFPMINVGTFTATFVAAAFYLYGALFGSGHRSGL